MKCLKCNAEIADTAKFCPICGAKVEKMEPLNKCPDCGEPLKDGAKFCTKCGCKIEKECTCPNCGAKLNEEAKFCTKCGTKIENGNVEKDVPAPILEQPVTEVIAPPIVTQDEEQPVVDATETLPDTNSTVTTERPKTSDKKTILIIAISAIVLVAIIVTVAIMSNNSNKSDDYYSNYSYSSNNNSLNNTYYNTYMSFKYPSNYKITDEETDEDGEISLNCETKGDDLSVITLSCGEDASLYLLDEQEKYEVCRDALKILNDEITSNTMYNVQISNMSKKTIGNCKGYYSDFTGKAYSYPIKGYIFVGVSGYYYVRIFAQAENDNYINQIDNILRTLVVNEEVLGIGDADDDMY